MTLGEGVFWGAAVLVGYAYLGYPAIVWALGRLLPRPVRTGAITPTMTILIAAHNEEARIGQKIENCLALAYRPERLDLIVISDGSTDRTAAIVEEYATRFPGRVELVSLPVRQGKANALNAGAALASGEILLLADVRQHLEPMAAQALARNFADPEVGAVSGELVLEGAGATGGLEGLGFYWRYEKALRQAESRFRSSISYTGAISAVRRSLFTPLPKETLLDDFVMPLRVAMMGYRIVFEPTARAFDSISSIPTREFARKVRTLAGVLQTLLHLREFVGPLPFRVWWQFVSHSVLRLVVPYALVLALLSSASLQGSFYGLILICQITTYTLGSMGLLIKPSRRNRLLSMPSTFLMLHAAAVIGPLSYLAGWRLELWQPAPADEVAETPALHGSSLAR